MLKALSERGAYHIQRLHLNRQPLIAYRRDRRLLQAARQAEIHLLLRLQDLEEQVQVLTAQLEQFDRSEPNPEPDQQRNP